MIKPASAPSMLPAKLFYFFIYAALAALSPFIALCYQQIGLSGLQIGLLVAIPSLMLLIGAPIFGAVADATQKYKALLLAEPYPALGCLSPSCSLWSFLPS